jgi:hypothetical protein
VTHRERLELAIRERRVFWDDRGRRPRAVRLVVPASKGSGIRLDALNRPLTSAERRVLSQMPVRYMRRRGSTGGIVVNAL